MRIPIFEKLQSEFGPPYEDQVTKGYFESLGDSELSKEAILNGAILHCEQNGINNVHGSSTYGIMRLFAQENGFYTGSMAELSEYEIFYVEGRTGSWNRGTTFLKVALYILAHY